jgi:hypothetical protein
VDREAAGHRLDEDRRLADIGHDLDGIPVLACIPSAGQDQNGFWKGHAMHTPYWEFFLSIEDELAQTTRYVEFNDDHLNVYSIAFSRILLASASEVDIVAKEMCRIIGPPKVPERIKDYRPIVLARFPNFPTMEVIIPRHTMSQKPWEEWAVGKSPTWWTAYHKVKHQRGKHFKLATLQNALGATMGLLCMLLYYYRLIFVGGVLIDPPPKLLAPAHYGEWAGDSIGWSYTLPDD